MINTINTKVRFISMLRSTGTSQAVSAELKNESSKEAKIGVEAMPLQTFKEDKQISMSDNSFGRATQLATGYDGCL